MVDVVAEPCTSGNDVQVVSDLLWWKQPTASYLLDRLPPEPEQNAMQEPVVRYINYAARNARIFARRRARANEFNMELARQGYPSFFDEPPRKKPELSRREKRAKRWGDS